MRPIWCVLVLCVAVPAAADPKPTLAVLGVQAKDPSAQAMADALTTAFRVQANAKASHYRVQGAPKDVAAAILAAECSAMQAACATKIATGLGADYALAGEVEKRGTHATLTLALVEVRTKQRIRSIRDTAAASLDATKWARTAFARLADGESGELQIAANAQRGDVFIDGQLVGALFEGRTTLTGLVNGSHRLAIRAGGFRPFEIDVDVEFTTKQALLLEPEPAK